MSKIHFKLPTWMSHNAWPALAVVAAASFLALFGLGNNAFWDDEANTALFARNLIHSGRLSAWDGTNLIGFRQGAELDSHLINVYMPPVQYHLAAWGFRLFGFTTFGGRLPFVAMGLLSIVALMLLTYWHFANRIKIWLPALLVALNPAYLMFVRQCRYYAVVSLLTLTILAAWGHPKKTRRSVWIAGGIGGAAAFLLMLTNYMNAVAAGLILPLLLFLRRYRTRQNLAYLIAIYCVLLCAGTYVLVTANPLANNVSYRSTITGIPRLAYLMWWHIVNLPRFEFFPLVFVPLLLGFALLQRGTPNAALAVDALLICALLFAYSVTIVAFSPQSVTSATRVADMRYVVALVPLGAMASAVVLAAFWRTTRWLGPITASVTGGLLILTNAFTSALMHWEPWRSTLVEYVRENAHNYTTGNEAIVEYLQTIPPGRVIRVIPDYMTYPAMFYVPQQHYCCQLGEDREMDPSLRAQLPDYVYFNRRLPDYIIVGANVSPQQLLYQSYVSFGPGKYRLGPWLGSDFRDCSRPEMPWHCFGPPTNNKQGFLVLERISPDAV